MPAPPSCGQDDTSVSSLAGQTGASARQSSRDLSPRGTSVLGVGAAPTGVCIEDRSARYGGSSPDSPPPQRGALAPMHASDTRHEVSDRTCSTMTTQGVSHGCPPSPAHAGLTIDRNPAAALLASRRSEPVLAPDRDRRGHTPAILLAPRPSAPADPRVRTLSPRYPLSAPRSLIDLHALAAGAIPQHVDIHPSVAADADLKLQIDEDAFRARIAQLPLIFPVHGDSVIRRLSEAAQFSDNVPAALARGNGVADRVPGPRPEALRDLPGTAPLAPIPTFWNVDALRRMLARHPNRALCEYVFHNLVHGADLFVELGADMTFADIAHTVGVDPPPPVRFNIIEHNDAALEQLSKYLAAGTVVRVPHGTRVCVHPADLVPKGDGGFRLIHDMSERGAPSAVNTLTSSAHWSTEAAHYHILAILIQHGIVAGGVRDIKSAYRTIPVRPSQQCLQAFYINGVCYASTVLTFGNRAAGFIWSALAALVHWIIDDQLASALGREAVVVTHVGDDYLYGVTRVAHLTAADILVDRILVELGDRAGRDKNQTGFQLVFIGVHVNLLEGYLAIKEDRRLKILDMLNRAINDDSLRFSKKELQSLSGTLAYISTHHAGAARVLTQSINTLAYAPHTAHGRVKLSREVRQDIRVLIWCLNRFNRLSIRTRCVTLIDTDASGGKGGYGGAACSIANMPHVLFMLFPFPSEFIPLAGKAPACRPLGQAPSSCLLELTTIVVAVFTFRDYLRGSTVVISSDSTSAIDSIREMYSSLPRSAQMLKCLAALTVSHDISYAPIHRPRDQLAHADWLSRGRVDKFRMMVPRAAPGPTIAHPAVLGILLKTNRLPETAEIMSLIA